MIGAIKRRWKSKKAKVLHKGNDLSSSSDSCPTSRGFVDGPDDFEKMIKPPSPRQVHPVLEKGDLKFHNFHHLLQQNNGNGNSPLHTYVLQQPPSGKKKSSTLPSSDEGGVGDKAESQDGCHFIRVNSGRIELVSKDSTKTNSSGTDQTGTHSPYNAAAERFLNRHLKNDVRHSWCGSAIRRTIYAEPRTSLENVPTSSSIGSLRREKTGGAHQPSSSSLMSSSTPVTTSPRGSPVKAPRTSRTTAIPKMNGSSSGNIAGACTSSSSLNRGNSFNSRNNGQSQLTHNNQSSGGVISLSESESSPAHHQNQSGNDIDGDDHNRNDTSLELSISSSSSFNSSQVVSNPSEMGNNSNNNPRLVANNVGGNSNNWRASRATTTTSSSGIPRVPSASSSPSRTSRIPCGNPTGNNTVGTPKPARRTATVAATATISSDRSCSPQRGSRLPVRKGAIGQQPPPPSALNRSPHPAATSKSLPSNNNMGTAFQAMSKSTGPQGNKHSKSTFGFGSRKSSGLATCSSGGAGSSNSSRGGSATGSSTTSRAGNRSNCPAVSSSSNLPERNTTVIGSGGSNSVTTSKPIKLAGTTCAVVAGITKASGKDEGYSTMSSEALAEQEHLLLLHHNHHNQNNSLEKSSQRDSKPFPFSIKSGNVKVASLPKTNKIAGVGLPTAVAASMAEPSGGEKRTSIHKSNTFNTFREMDSRQRIRNQSQRSYRVCDDDDDDEDDDEFDGDAIRPRNNYGSAGSRIVSRDVMTTPTSSSTRQSTSLPNSSSSASSSPSKGKSSASSATKRTSKSSKDRVTTTRMMDGNIVRIVRGSPYSIRFGEESGDDMEDEEDPSSSTILWEDSDDSDILFLPLEVSESSSRSTLVPPPQSSGESRSYYSSWGRGSSAVTTATCSTLEQGGSNTSIDNSASGGVVSGLEGGGTFTRRAYPLRRSKGEVTVDIVLVNNGVGGTCSGTSNITNKMGQFGEGITNPTDEYNNEHIHNTVTSPHDDDEPPHHTTDDMEEKALIEKWMQLEEVRNEQVHGGEQWAWDWDGVERTYTRVLRNGRRTMRQIPVELDEDDDDIDVDLILEGSGLADCELDEIDRDSSAVEERNALNERGNGAAGSIPMQIDSSTWTRTKSAKKKATQSQANKEAEKKMDGNEAVKKCSGNSQEASPEKMRRGGESAVMGLEGECEDKPLIKSANKDGVDESSRFFDESVIAIASPFPGEEQVLGEKLETSPKSHSTAINLNENGIVVTSCGDGNEDQDHDDGGDADGEDDPPPVIEFTPEFYRLTNYGSNLSFSDNESAIGNCSALMNPDSAVPASPKLVADSSNSNKSGPSSPARSPKKRKPSRRSHSITESSPIPAPKPPPQSHQSRLPLPVLSSSLQQAKMDDKISQTDFSCSSLENMSSVSSELSAEYRNCLDIIKKLVSNGDTDEAEEGGSSASRDYKTTESRGKSGALSKTVDAATYATTWVNVPKGLPTAEVDRILEILSSSESEGVLSPK